MEVVSDSLPPSLTPSQDNVEVVSDSLDILCELLARFGSVVPSEHLMRVKELSLGYLGEGRAALRKKAVHALGEWEGGW